jgi:hypothetical protein
MDELIRTRTLRPGDVVTVHRCAGAYTELPPNLDEGATVKVVETHIGYARVTSGNGDQFEVALPQIDMPRDIWWHGKWIDRGTHPDGERAFRWALDA